MDKLLSHPTELLIQDPFKYTKNQPTEFLSSDPFKYTKNQPTEFLSSDPFKYTKNQPTEYIVQELCESRGGRPGLSVLTSLLVSVDVKIYCTVLRHWSQLVPNMSHDI